MIRSLRYLLIIAIIPCIVFKLQAGYPLEQYLNIQYAVSPSFKPDGLEILYRSDITGVPQLWRISSFSGYQTQVTFDTNGVDGGWWSPVNPNLIVIAADVGGTERTQLYLADPYGSEWHRITKDDNAIYSFNGWSHDGSRFAFATNERNKKDFDVFEYHPDAGEVFKLYEGTGMNSAGSYSPDNRFLLLVQTLSSADGNILLYDREIGRTRLLTPHHGDVTYTSPDWDATGKGFYFLTNEGREFTGLAYWPLDSVGFRWVETPNWDIESVAVSPDGGSLAWTVNEKGYVRLAFRNLHSGSDMPSYRLPRGVVSGLAYAPDGARLAFTMVLGDRPADVWVYQPAMDRLAQVTFSATGGIPPATFRAPELVEYETFDGRMIPAWWYTPEKKAGPMPVIVSAHGGPEGQSQPCLSGLYQYFVSRGFAILEPNFRGSTGYGKSYLSLDDGQKCMDAVADVEYAARWLASRSDVDSTKLIIYGGSYGGFMVLSSLSTYPDRWAAGVSVDGIADSVTLTYVDGVKAPLMLVQGANDPHVPKAEADLTAEAIRSHGGIVEYLLFEDEGHGLSKTRNRITAYSAMADFLEKHVVQK